MGAFRSTKIVATIGPASREPEVLRRMVEAGMDVARLNFAHGTPEQHAETAERVRAAASAAGREVAVLQDVPGPKLRIGPVPGDVMQLGGGSEVVLVPGEDRAAGGWPATGRLARASLSSWSPAQVVYLADGAIRLRVERS